MRSWILRVSAAAVLATSIFVATTSAPASAATGTCVVPWRACETGSVPADDGRIWVAVQTSPWVICSWRVVDTDNWEVIRTATSVGSYGTAIGGVHSWYRLELTNCAAGSTGLIT